MVVVALVATVVVVSTVRASLPKTSGSAELPGLTTDVTVMRDGSGIPHIFGDSLTDLARAQGYVHAQEQFFQMDLRRHVTAGRLSELVGKDGVETDKVVRTLGWRRIAEEELPTLKPQTRQMLQAYADGVNTYLRGRSPREVSVEYAVLGLTLPTPEIEEWTPLDSLTWLKAMAWDLKGNYDDELARARLSGRLTGAQINQIYPAYDAEAHPPILGSDEWSPQVQERATQSAVPSALTTAPARAKSADAGGAPADARITSPSAQAAYATVHAALNSIPQLVGRGEGVGSNSWVVAGSRTTTGKPLLANDPHLGVSQPGIWIQNSLTCRTVSESCPMDVSGFSFAGVPGVVIGHNANIAWGFTNLGPDVSDFYLERVIGDTYLRDGTWQPVTSRQEVIKVAGAADQSITVRSTVHGPVLSDVVDGIADAGSRAPTEQEGDETETYAVSLAWTGLVPGRTADAILDLDLATDFDTFREAARSFAVPAQNLLYADKAGHIGYQAPGQVPIRRPAIPRAPAGYWPAPGWDSTYDWQGYVEFSELPWALDPKDGVIVAANQAVTRSATPFLTTEWDQGWRSTRIGERLAALPKVAPADMADIQLDTQDSFAKVLVPALLAVPLEASEAAPDTGELLDFTREARELLRTWDFTTPTGNAEAGAAAAYYNAVWRNLLELLFDDELPDRAQGRRRRALALGRAEAAHHPQERVVGQQADPERHRGQGRDPAPGPRRGPSRADPRARQGPRQVAVGQAAPARPPARGARRRDRARAGALAGQRGPVRDAGRLVDRQRERLERQRGLRGRLGAVDADGRRPVEPRRVDLDQPDRGERPPRRRPLRRPDRRLGRGSSATVAVQRGRRARHRPRRAHPPAGGVRRHGLSPRSVTPSAVTTASTGWSCGWRGRGEPDPSTSSPGCSTTTTGVPGRRRGSARS